VYNFNACGDIHLLFSEYMIEMCHMTCLSSSAVNVFRCRQPCRLSEIWRINWTAPTAPSTRGKVFQNIYFRRWREVQMVEYSNA